MKWIPNDTGGIIHKHDWILVGVGSLTFFAMAAFVLYFGGFHIPEILFAIVAVAFGLGALQYAGACWKQRIHNPEDVDW